MFGLITLALSLGISWFGYGTARRFVRERLRYVEAALKPSAALLAGIGGAVLLTPIAWLLPFVTGGTALVFGISVALGTRAGANDVKRGYRISSGDF